MLELRIHQGLGVLSDRNGSVFVLPSRYTSLGALHGAHHALLLAAIHDVVQVAAVLG